MTEIIDLNTERAKREAIKKEADFRKMLGYDSPRRSKLTSEEYAKRLRMTFSQINDVELRRREDPDYLMDGIDKPEA